MTALFITGADTEVGKTYVACQIARQAVAAGKRVGVYKPVASGCRDVDGERISDDAAALWEAAGRPRTLDDVCPQRFLAPLAPSRAAAAESRRVDEAMLTRGLDVWRDGFDLTLIEGAGGYFSPISETLLNADLAVTIGQPLVIVVANQLGAINQALQTVFVAQRYRGGLPIAAVALNSVRNDGDESAASNAEEIRRRLDETIPLLTLPHGGMLDWKPFP